MSQRREVPSVPSFEPALMGLSSQGDLRPIPDPTARSRDLVHREIASLEKFLLARIAAAANVRQEQFNAIRTQFEERDAAARMAVQMLNQSSSEARGKAEASFEKQLAQLAAAQADRDRNTESRFLQQAEVFGAKNDAAVAGTHALQSRVDRMEAQTSGHEKGIADFMGWIVAAVALVGNIITVAVMIVRR